MTKVLDAKDMQLREVNSYSAADVTSQLRPELAKVGAVTGSCERILEAVLAMDAKNSASMDGMACDIRTVLAAVESNAALTESQSSNLVRHLGSFGMIDVGSTYDIPTGISSIYRLLNEEIAPVFRSGAVVPIYGHASGAVDSNGAVTTVLEVASSGNAGIVFQNRASPAQALPRVPKAGFAAAQTQGGGSMGHVGGHMAAPAVPTSVVYEEDGILRVPAKYRELEKNYMRVPGPRQDSFVHQTPPTQATVQQQQFSVPPPPMKKMRFEGTTAVRSVFQPYAQPAQGSSVTRQGVVPQGHGQPAVFLPQQTFQPRSLFSMPPPPLHQSSVITQEGPVITQGGPVIPQGGPVITQGGPVNTQRPQVPTTNNPGASMYGGANGFYQA